MDKSITQQVEDLPTMSRVQLVSLWSEVFRQAAPPMLHRSLMISILAYRIQEREFGGLSNSARQKIKQLGKALRSENRSKAARASPLKRGTRLIRSWGGEVHEVNINESGYEYRGKEFRSLSEIAREITGTRWSGPLFFGTKKEVA